MIKGRVSFLMAAYNHEEFIEAALQSVVDQTYGDIEIVVVDDGSTDGTLALAKAFQKTCPRPMTVIAQENRGQAQATTVAYDASSGEFVRAMPSDDVIAPDATEWQVKDLIEHDADAVYGSYVRLLPGRKQRPEPLQEFTDEWNPEMFKASHTIGRGPMIQCGIFRRSLIDEIGGANQGHPLDDWPVHFAVADTAQRVIVRQRIVMYYRIHGENLSIRRAQDLLAWKRDLIKKHLRGGARRRGLAASYQYAALNLRHERWLLALGFFLRGFVAWPRLANLYRFLGLTERTRDRLHRAGRRLTLKQGRAR